ncbi:MAG: hypothetical protein GEU73_05475 [Chloroflexi bacterium]|nr:hypothetical protein [Chloroflexota bacterium]
MAATGAKTIRMAMVGIGVGGAEILPAMESTEGIELYAGADVNPTTRERFKTRYPEAKVYDSIEALCADPDVDAVWVSTPNRLHAPHAVTAANNGKHVVVEKPMALSLREAEQIVEAGRKNNVQVMAGHTMAYSYPIRAMRRIINSGKLGRLTNLQALAYTDWLLRPRSAEELDPNQGGGVPWRQTPHQVDSMRLMGGGKVRSVRGMTGKWGDWRPIEGFYTAYLEFEDGTPCHIIHNGYGYFLTGDLVPWGDSTSRYTPEERGELRRAMRAGTRNEEADKQALRIGGEAEQRVFRQGGGPRPWSPGDLGVVLVCCENGVIRHSKFGLFIYDDDGQHDMDMTSESANPIAQRRGELVEFHASLAAGKPLFHDGIWGMGTIEVALAIMQSARERREIVLSHQVAVPDTYDAELSVPYLDDKA